MMKQELAENDPLYQNVSCILEAAQRAARLTRELLAYAGKAKFYIEPLNLSKLVRDMGSLMRTTISGGISFDLVLDSALPMIWADTAQLQQVVMNLLINAAEACGTNGSVTLRTGTRIIDGECQMISLPNPVPPGKYVFMEVRDTGKGMAPETLERIFDPFFTTKFTGRGLGLSAVMGIVKGHRGTINVVSSPGKGATFTIMFPATDEPEREERISGSDAKQRGAGLVLVVDDDELVRGIAKVMLERKGFDVELAEGGNGAIEIAKKSCKEILAVILDLTMPGMSGEETLWRLKAVCPDVKIFMSSGYDQSEIINRIGDDVVGFIQKPYTFANLIDPLFKIAQKQKK